MSRSIDLFWMPDGRLTRLNFFDLVSSKHSAFLCSPPDTPQGLGWGYSFQAMPLEPAIKRACAFVDGQNLYHAAREAFGYRQPNYDVRALAEKICRQQTWDLSRACFYTGYPDATDDPFWNHYWMAKFAQMGREKISVYKRTLRYRNQTVSLPDGTTSTVLVGQEKGIDVRLALDIIGFAHKQEYDVALVFSQDQDLSEVADEIREIARTQGRWIKMVSAFPVSPTSRNKRGINSTDWVKIDRAAYDACLDPRDYRPKPTTK
jgi:uncharacterized LabA/DUF88 family protein